ncbi:MULTISPECIES: three component ABC system middle component [Pseudoalteromonas]|uniref:three component ABC system middle component n=1 Tax=Pseudoalteromonas TaxID=53246 RepID=UPI00057FA0EB|nr:three component ABC system middle component [Pseudoalteromonas flavipulchra]KID38841.1 hypothetical protein QT15_02715 [Pseudoalteromonas flavipulchra NCIMB 2033 = ATCC BAA-314]MBD0783605.1 hypothetical protein [Pseudoalteromonas flavipulchra]MBE0375075.1 hypothetical protein [Pseudoalteromonas flavipulchra NCIMB 2033 = ATCC BAA-314]
MANAIHQLSVLSQSPYLLAPLLLEFYQHVEVQPKNILLSYLVFPLLFSPVAQTKLQRINRSTLNTKFGDPTTVEGLEKRLNDFKEITNKAMQVLLEQGLIKVNADLSIQYMKEESQKNHCKQEHIKAARNLAKLVNPFLVEDCYRILRIKKL